MEFTELEKNPKTRSVLKNLLRFEDKLAGKPFPAMIRVGQISMYACGPATLAMLFSFVKLRVSQKSIVKSIRAAKKIKLYGINVYDMARAAKIVGRKNYVFWRKDFATIEDLNLAINKYKYPVGIEWQGVFYEHEDEDSGHYSVVTKINKKRGYLRIADSFFNKYLGYGGVDRRFKISEFFKKWWDTNEVKKPGTSKTKIIKDTRVMFVIVPRNEKWPVKIGMRKI